MVPLTPGLATFREYYKSGSLNVEKSFYADQLNLFLKYFDRRQILVFSFEQLTKVHKFSHHFHSGLKFLHILYCGRVEFHSVNIIHACFCLVSCGMVAACFALSAPVISYSTPRQETPMVMNRIALFFNFWKTWWKGECNYFRTI